MAVSTTVIHILLADDDRDDRYFFKKALGIVPFKTELQTIADGEKLMEYLSEPGIRIPDLLFLDLNMPLKNGAECLGEIKKDPRFKDMPVIIYSTSLNEAVADVLYNEGAHYFIRKQDFPRFRKFLFEILTLVASNEMYRPQRSNFVQNLIEA
jgi:CheY-like chemotaxis protein